METPVHQVESYELTTPSTLPVGDATDLGKDYSQTEFFVDLCFNVLVRPTRISPRQPGAAGPRSKYPSGVRGKARYVGYVLQSSSADRAESLGL